MSPCQHAVSTVSLILEAESDSLGRELCGGGNAAVALHCKVQPVKSGAPVQIAHAAHKTSAAN